MVPGTDGWMDGVGDHLAITGSFDDNHKDTINYRI